MKRRLFSTGLALATLGPLLAAPAPALARRVGPSSRVGGLMQIAIVERDSGIELPVYRHGGEYWVAGRPGARYAIRGISRASGRVLAVMSVDGVNVLTGETAGWGQDGYVYSPGEMGDIAGWRKSDAQIAAFEFTSVDNAYASRTGRPGNVGVIGVALFRERVAYAPPPVSMEERSRHGGAAAESEAAPPGMARQQRDAAVAAAPSLGTGHGRRETSHVSRTTFERASSRPDELIQIRYDSRDKLIAAGIIPSGGRPWPRPAPFPETQPGYVPDPPPRY